MAVSNTDVARERALQLQSRKENLEAEMVRLNIEPVLDSPLIFLVRRRKHTNPKYWP